MDRETMQIRCDRGAILGRNQLGIAGWAETQGQGASDPGGQEVCAPHTDSRWVVGCGRNRRLM